MTFAFLGLTPISLAQQYGQEGSKGSSRRPQEGHEGDEGQEGIRIKWRHLSDETLSTSDRLYKQMLVVQRLVEG